MSKLRLAVVGCGAAARNCHLPALPRLPDITLSTLIDPRPTHAAAALERYRATGGEDPGVVTASRIEDALDRFDAAIVVAPHTLHAGLAERLLTRGKHVLMEKPMAVSTTQAERLVELASGSALLAMAHPRRLFPASRWIRTLLDTDALGRVQTIKWREGSPYSWQPTTMGMFDLRLCGGGVTTDTGSHVLDLLLWWFGDGAEVVDYLDNSLGGAETDARITLRWPGRDLVGKVELSWSRPLGTSCTVVGQLATATIGTDFPAGICSLVSADGGSQFRGEVAAVPPAQDEWEELFVEQLRNFAGAVRGEVPPYSTVHDGRRVVDLIDSCYHGPARRSWPQPWISSVRSGARA